MGRETIWVDDLRCWQAVMRQEPHAGEVFFARFYPVIADCLAWVAYYPYNGLSDEHRRHIIDEATSHALHRLLDDPRYFDPTRSGLRPLLARIAINCAKDLIRSETRRELRFPRQIVPEGADDEGPPVQGQAADRPVEDDIATHEDTDRVHRAIGMLLPLQRYAINLRLRGYSTQEIAQALGKSPDATESLIRRALARLRILLANSEQ